DCLCLQAELSCRHFITSIEVAMATRIGLLLFGLTFCIPHSFGATCPADGEDALSPDIVAELQSATVASNAISYELVLTNCGASMDEPALLFSKGLLVPKANYKDKLVGTGTVLATTSTELNL